jgi:hypothetical protein
MQDYNRIDQHLHQLVQTIAKANRTFVLAKEDDGHTNLYFEPVSCRIYGHWIVSKEERYILSLNLIKSEFEWLNDEWSVVQSHSIVGRTQSQMESDIQGGLPQLHLDPTPFITDLHYEIPDYNLGEHTWEAFSMTAVKEWVKWHVIANEASLLVSGALQSPAEIRLWPHHFDTGIYIQPNKKRGIGFGLAMQDSIVGAPYFYCTGTDLMGKELVYSNLPDLTFGHWVVGGTWNGAVLSLRDLQDNEMVKIRTFISETLAWLVRG